MSTPYCFGCCYWILVFYLYSLWFFQESYCHGYLHDPPQRSSLWRHGFKAPENYNDFGLNCGGIGHQWAVHNGLCGVCGDPWGRERHHEDGGKYATGIIGRKYTSGSVIETVVNITAWHRGYFEYKLCPKADPFKPISQECLDQYPLTLANGSTKYFPHKHGVFHVKVKLPDGLYCPHCVLQWIYTTTNNWGCNGQGECGLGYDPYPEQFVNCADIQIDESIVRPTSVPKDKIVNVLRSPNWEQLENNTSSSESTEDDDDQTKTDPTKNIIRQTSTTVAMGTVTCAPKGLFFSVPGMIDWCNLMCLEKSSCPSTHCECKS